MQFARSLNYWKTAIDSTRPTDAGRLDMSAMAVCEVQAPLELADRMAGRL
ncbi:hypothetical protein BSU04_36985 [Caballeronia sordidicola]|uniref:Uncharacterized protein n=1 Tax=Caballeronia sordidicola TaxID=196367 RepID=A0A226WRH5_CABSO|nr:hypothetical protein BSU04_36985 [Caballeronia sordidicola]